jgi:hypothetical protein
MSRYSPFILYTLFLCGMLAHSFMPMSNVLILQIVKLVLGLISLILIPGIFIVNFFKKDAISNIAFAFIFGFLLQLLAVYIIWWLYTFAGGMNFINLQYVTTGILTFVLMLVTVKLKCEIKYNFFLKKDLFVVFPIILCIGLVLFYPGFNAAFSSDGGAYLDLARNVVANNVFSSHLIQSYNSWAQAQWSTGMIDHFFGYSAIAVFFALGNISLLTAEFMLLFVGILSLFPLYIISDKLFGRRVARITVFIFAVSPIILYHLTLIGGPDVVSLLFTLTTLCLLFIAVEGKTPKLNLYFISGITLFIAWYAWTLNGYILLLYLPLFFLFNSLKLNTKLLNFGFFAILLLILCFFTDFFITGQITLRYLGMPLPLISIVMLLVIYKLNNKFSLPNFYFVFLTTSILFVFFASYMPRLISAPFIHFDTTSFPTAQIQVTANTAQILGTLTQAFDMDRVLNFTIQYLFGWSFSWAGLLNTFGVSTILLAVTSLVQLNKLKATLLIFAFPIIQMLLWILMSSEEVVQPRYLLSLAPFYFILVASAIDLIISYANLSRFNRIQGIFVKTLSLANFGKLLVSILVIITIIASWQPIYVNLSQNVTYWDYSKKYNWNGAISWIKSNTTSNDVLATVYADCFVWLTNRPTVFLYNEMNSNANTSTLIDTIRTSRVNYLIVDLPFSWKYANLQSLYESPNPFLGSTIVYMNKDVATNTNIIIYNVTNIAYGSVIHYDFTPDLTKLKNWQPLTYYSLGNVSLNNDTIRFDLTAGNTPWPSVASTFTFSSPTNLSQYSSVKFWINVPELTNMTLEMFSGLIGLNYLSYHITNIGYDKWVEVVFVLSEPSGVIGEPSLQNTTKMNFIVAGSIGQSITFFIKDLDFYNETYVLNSR